MRRLHVCRPEFCTCRLHVCGLHVRRLHVCGLHVQAGTLRALHTCRVPPCACLACA
jgi:hypothetical protein